MNRERGHSIWRGLDRISRQARYHAVERQQAVRLSAESWAAVHIRHHEAAIRQLADEAVQHLSRAHVEVTA